MRRNILILYHEGSCFATKLKPTLLPAQPEDYLHQKGEVNSRLNKFIKSIQVQFLIFHFHQIHII